LARQPRISLAQLVGEQIIGVPRQHAPVLYDAIHEFADRHGVVLQPAYHAETLMMALSLIHSVGGVCLLPERSSLMFPQGVVARPMVEDTPLLELALAWHPDNSSGALTSFIAAFATQITQGAPA
jgi:LysR family hca operon transcriptional activator